MWVKAIRSCVPTSVLFTALLVLTFFSNESTASVADKDLTLTSNEEIALVQLKERVLPFVKLDYMKTDFYLIRWLRVKNLNVAQAQTMLLQHLRWRQANQIDTILQESWTDMEADYPYTLDTQDLEGQPVGTVEVYEWDLRRVILQGRSQRLLRYLYRLMEVVSLRIFLAQGQGQNVTRFVVLGNADGFNLVQHACPLCLPIWVQFVHTFEAQYPGFLDELIVVEAPGTVNVVLDLVRPILSAATRNSLKIFGHNREKWMEYLDSKISREQRRPSYGGTKSD